MIRHASRTFSLGRIICIVLAGTVLTSSLLLAASRPSPGKDNTTIRRPFDLPIPASVTFTPESDHFLVELSAVLFDPGFGEDLGLGDDDTTEVVFVAGFPFLGTTYTSLYVNSDGNVTLGEGDSASTRRDAVRLVGGPPRVAPLMVDLNPSGSGSVHADVRSDRLVVTWSDVPRFADSVANTFQAVLHADGSIDLVYADVHTEIALVGVAAGGARGPVHELDLSAELPVTREAGALFEEFSVVEWVSDGPFAGWIVDLAIDPLTPSTLYAASNTDFFKSTDSGESWERTALNGVTRSVPYTIAIDPVTPSTLYLGTCNRSGSGGVLKSTDGGKYWTAKEEGLTDWCVADLAVDPTHPSTLYAGTGFGSVRFSGGVFKSDDGGESWILTGDETATTALAIDPLNSSTLYAATIFDGSFKSSDGGGSWAPLGDEVGSDTIVDTWAIHPTNPSTLYAGTYLGELLKSTDGGESWIRTYDGSESVLDLVVDPLHPTTLYAGTRGRGVLKSTDAGESWATVNNGLSTEVSALAVHPSDPSILYAGTLGGLPSGVFKTTNGGEEWTVANHGLNATKVLDLVTAPAQPGTLYAATQTSGMFRSSDGGRSWTAIGNGIGAFARQRALAVAPSRPTTLYAGFLYYGIRKSTDGGQSWVKTGISDATVSSLAVDPVNSSTVYAGTERGEVFKSLDGGESWDEILIASWITALVVDPTDPSTLYVIDEELGLIKSTDGGQQFRAINDGLPTFGLRALATDPSDPSTLYAGTGSAGLFKSIDGGESWTSLNLPYTHVRSLAVDETALYAATCGVVSKSTDGGESWTTVSGNGLMNLCVESLVVDPFNPLVVYAGTNGGGVLWTEQERPTCTPDATTRCLNDGRFTVEVDWRDFDNNQGAGQVVPIPITADDSGLFWFFNSDNWEMLVKVLDGCGNNDRFWVFSAATTNVEYTLRVTDTETGAVKEYFNPLGNTAPAITDTGAFATCTDGSRKHSRTPERVDLTALPASVLVPEAAPALKADACVKSDSNLCLNQGRFQVEVDWTDFRGETGSGQRVLFESDDSGLFWFFNSDNWEMLVKVLNGCHVNDHFWVFAAATTSVEYTLSVTDTETGTMKEYFNPLGNSAAAVTDIDALATCQNSSEGGI